MYRQAQNFGTENKANVEILVLDVTVSDNSFYDTNPDFMCFLNTRGFFDINKYHSDMLFEIVNCIT